MNFQRANRTFATVLAVLCSLSPAGCFGPNAAVDTEGAGDASSTGSDSETDASDASSPTSGVPDGEGPDGGSGGEDVDSSTSTGGGPECGNGSVEGDEVCDDGTNDGSYGGCMPGCEGLAPRCGDGVIQEDAAEVCDDGNTVEDATCPASCGLPGGTVLWQDVHQDEDGHDAGHGITPDLEGGFIVAGTVRAASTGRLDGYYGTGWMRRIDHTGELAWNSDFEEDAAASTGRDIVLELASRDGAFVAAFRTGNGGSVRTYAVDGGAEDWSRSFASGFATDVDIDADGFVIASGLFDGQHARGTDENGIEIWGRTFDQGVQECPAVAYATDGAVYVGCNYTLDRSGSDIRLLKLDPTDGDTRWSVMFASPGGEDDTLKAVAATQDAGVVVAATVQGAAWFRRYDTEGTVAWTRTRPSVTVDSLVVDGTGEVFWVGTSEAQTGVVGRLSADEGAEQWTMDVADAYGNGTVDAVHAVALGAEGELLTTGTILQENVGSAPANWGIWAARISP